jgi:hypothetical protein
MRILIATPHHLHHADSLARGFKALPDCEVTLLEHGWPGATGQPQSGRRWRQAWQRWLVSRRLCRQVLAAAPEVLLCLDPLCLTPADAARLRQRLTLVAWSLDAHDWRSWPAELIAAYHRIWVADPAVRRHAALHYLAPAFDPVMFHWREAAPDLPVADLLWVGSAHESLLPRLNTIAKLCEQADRRFHVHGYLHPSPLRELDLARSFPYLHRSLRDNARVPPTLLSRLHAQGRAVLILQSDEAPLLATMRGLLQACASGRQVLSDAHDLPDQWLQLGEHYTPISLDDPAALAQVIQDLPAQPLDPAAASQRVADLVATHSYRARLQELLAQLPPR